MPAAHGRKTRVYINAYDLTGFYRKAGSECSREVADATPFNVDDKVYVAGTKDASMSLEGMFDGAINGIEQVLHTALDSDPTTIAICPQGDVLGNVAYGMQSLETKFAVDASKDDIVTLANELQSTVGHDRLLVHHALSTEVATGQAAGINHGAPTTNGGVGYLHVPDIAGITNLAVVIQDSADGSTGWTTILTFTGVTADRNAQRVAIAGTVRAHTRTLWTFTGAGSSQFWVGFGRK